MGQPCAQPATRQAGALLGKIADPQATSELSPKWDARFHSLQSCGFSGFLVIALACYSLVHASGQMRKHGGTWADMDLVKRTSPRNTTS